MTEPSELTETQETTSPLLAYGVGGDYTGARRLRRSFRRCVLAAIVFAGALYFVESFLRYDLIETQYMRALTLEDDSKRAILRNVVRRDAELGEARNQSYVEALAAIEEEDQILTRYEEAYQLNPKNQRLLINYGAQLYHATQFRRAREVFREASLIQPPRNALPRYLEAAALLAGDNSETAMREAMALVERANASGDPLRFPQPLWHENLSTSGSWYREMQRDVADRCLAPLYAFESALGARARSAIENESYGDWETWLRELERLGERLAGLGQEDFETWTVSQSLAGVLIKQDALEYRKQLHEMRDGVADTVALRSIQEEETETRLAQALDLLRDFEETQAEGIKAHAARVDAPIDEALHIFGLLFLMWFVAVVVSGVTRTQRAAWAVPHSKGSRFALWGATATFFVLLTWLSLAAAINSDTYVISVAPKHVFSISLVVLTFVGLLNPFLSLPVPSRITDEDPNLLKSARRAYRDAVLVLIRRYFACLLGVFLIACSAWFVTHRLVFSSYPTDKKLITTGMHEESIEIMNRVRDVVL